MDFFDSTTTIKESDEGSTTNDYDPNLESKSHYSKNGTLLLSNVKNKNNLRLFFQGTYPPVLSLDSNKISTLKRCPDEALPSLVNSKVIKLDQKMETKNPIISDEVPIEIDPENFEDTTLKDPKIRESYANYNPTHLKIGKPHPFPVVESRTLSSIKSPKIRYSLNIPETIIKGGILSNVQLESVLYACQRHGVFLDDNRRAAFLVGDGAGVGKGRTVAGIILENYLMERRKAIWLSVSNDLKMDAIRDLTDLGQELGIKIEVKSLNKMSYQRINSSENDNFNDGVLFITYSSLISTCRKKGNGLFNSRFDQIVEWFGTNNDGVIIFDECHKAKEDKTKTGNFVIKLQETLRNSRIVYASATGASEPRHMAYMCRLGLWGPGTLFTNFDTYKNTLVSLGVGAMELIAIELKMKGMYLARQLHFKNVKFEIKEAQIKDSMIKEYKFDYVYNKCVELWATIYKEFLKAFSRNKIDNITVRFYRCQFWSSHQRFFKYLCISAKIQECVKIVMDEIQNGKCVVIGLQSTGEARTVSELNDNAGELADYVSTAAGVLENLVEQYYPSQANLNKIKIKKPLKKERKKDKTAGKENNPYDIESEFMDFSDDSFDSFIIENKELFENKVRGSTNATKKSKKTVNDSETIDLLGSSSDGYIEDKPIVENKRKQNLKNTAKKRKPPVKIEEAHPEIISLSDDSSDFFICDDNSIESENNISFNKPIGEEHKNIFLKSQVPVEKNEIEIVNNLLEKIKDIKCMLPMNVLDELIYELGGPEYVAEMTGRKGRIVEENGIISYKSRKEPGINVDQINLQEKDRFNNGNKLIAIISDAASIGISLHSDMRFVNKRQRVHLTLELPWSADKAVQQFGRTHRSNQVIPPHYIFLISDLAGEKRFAATVAKRLESLGAITHGDRRCVDSSNLCQYNLDNDYGLRALNYLLHNLFDHGQSPVPYPRQYLALFNNDNSVFRNIAARSLESVGINSSQKITVPRFLNRILGIKLNMQNGLFQYFLDIVGYVSDIAKSRNEFDHGIRDIENRGNIFSLVNTTSFNGIIVNRVRITFEGVNYKSVLKKHVYDSENIFCASKDNPIRLLAFAEHHKNGFKITTPNFPIKMMVKKQFYEMYDKIDFQDAKELWEKIHQESAAKCLHVIGEQNCDRKNCSFGRRVKFMHIITGSVLSALKIIRSKLPELRLEIIRIELQDGTKFVGGLIPEKDYQEIIQALS